jgi:hypothetical protein
MKRDLGRRTMGYYIVNDCALKNDNRSTTDASITRAN